MFFMRIYYEDSSYFSDFMISGYICCEINRLINEETFLFNIVVDMMYYFINIINKSVLYIHITLKAMPN